MDYPGGPNIIIKVLVKGGEEGFRPQNETGPRAEVGVKHDEDRRKGHELEERQRCRSPRSLQEEIDPANILF